MEVTPVSPILRPLSEGPPLVVFLLPEQNNGSFISFSFNPLHAFTASLIIFFGERDVSSCYCGMFYFDFLPLLLFSAISVTLINLFRDCMTFSLLFGSHRLCVPFGGTVLGFPLFWYYPDSSGPIA